MDRINLLTTQKLTQYGFIDGNVETKIVINVAWRIQETQVQPILGSPLYNKLLDEIKGGLTGGDYYDLMVEYVIPAFIPLVEYKMTFHNTNQITNKTTGKNSDEHIKANSVGENNNLRDELKKDATFFRNQLIRFLCDDNGEKYPEYLERTGNSVDLKPTDDRPDYESMISIL